MMDPMEMRARIAGFVVNVNPVGQGRILHHLRLGRFERAGEVCYRALDGAFRAWEATGSAGALRRYREVLRLWLMIRRLAGSGG